MGYNGKGIKDSNKMLKDEQHLEKCINEAREAIVNKEYFKAKLYLNEALAIDSSNAKIENLIGVVEELMGNRKLAQNYYRAALSFDSTYGPAENNLKRTSLYNSGIYKIDLGE